MSVYLLLPETFINKTQTDRNPKTGHPGPFCVVLRSSLTRGARDGAEIQVSVTGHPSQVTEVIQANPFSFQAVKRPQRGYYVLLALGVVMVCSELCVLYINIVRES